MMNPKDLIQKQHDELTRLAAELSADIRDLRFKVATRQNAKVRMLRNAKKDLARVLTALTQKKPTTHPHV
ncbi:50S ribosomal protein L29 [Patescibacteria group bacterium]|nr:50S ribosomal protein L29 [Patescibacteria group bacterium]MBU1448720.1 50S ribosomal protein L29 [Patescibacteria group bacterium]MBU2613110.1 50S ribosomal protein L29 [Patescibacteria group bacterium]